MIAVLIMMVLITVIAIGLLGLATIELRSSSRSIAMHEARANARMAMVFAIGSLQKHAGPDQRVTGESEFLGSNATAESSVANPHWTSVWKSTMPDDLPVVQRQGNGGGLRDRRFTEGWDAEDDLLAQLVSGNESELSFTADTTTDGDSRFETLVGEGSLGDDDVDDRSLVRVPKVKIGTAEKVSGEYAWWVGDLGTRANIATVDRFSESSDSKASIRQLQIAQDFSAIGLGADETTTEDRQRFVTPAEFDIHLGKNSGSKESHFFALTTDSETVLADVRDGGLKKDLTPYLIGNGTIADLSESPGLSSLGVADDDKLIGPQNSKAKGYLPDGGEANRMADISPTFALLRHWAQRAEDTSLSTSKLNPDYAESRDSLPGFYGQNKLPVEFENLEKSEITPILVESSIYYNLSYYQTDSTDLRQKNALRLHLYPRVAIWNPYNVSLNLGPSMIGMQINGAKDIEVTLQNRRTQLFKMSWGLISNESNRYDGPRRGTHYFRLNGTTIAPGETVVFSPAGNRIYDNVTFSNNTLSADVPPDPTRSFYMDKRPESDPAPSGGEKDALFKVGQTFPPNPGIKNDHVTATPIEWREVVGVKPSGNVQAAGYTQADDYWMYWKPITPGSGSIDLAAFSRLPHGRFVSCAFQYGDEDELPVQWSTRDPVPFQQSDASGVTRQIPDRRTRDGFRMRWFREHPSNVGGSGSLAQSSHFDSAAIANWNMRASYSLRSPFENVTDVAPHFFGIYTRDLFDDAVSWTSMTPRSGSGHQLGDPFDQPLSGTRRILFDVPRTGAEVVSLGAFQHLKFSELMWSPTYAFGNSLADPRIERSMTQPNRASDINSRDGGWNRDAIGYSTDGRSENNNGGASNADNWAYTARRMLDDVPIDQNTIFDLSYELNHSLWDRFFLSTGSPQEKRAFIADPNENPLPNGRLQPISSADDTEDAVLDFHRAASALMLEGGFNVNSTSVEAWEALLLSSMGIQEGETQVTFPRIINLTGPSWNGQDATSQIAWSGQRTIEQDEIRQLAESIVTEVKLRGPFLSMSDFVNRRLKDDETGRMGALESAIRRSRINNSFTNNFPLNNQSELPDYRHPDNIKDATRISQTAKPDSTAWGALGYVTQADILQSIGPVLTARSDTFVVRSYGSSVGKDGKVEAEAWCEAVVQRTPEPISPDASGLNPDKDASVDFGRRFRVKRFRWIHRDEV